MATVNAIFSGNLTDASDVAIAVAPASKPALYVNHAGPGKVRLSVAVYADATGANVIEESSLIGAGVSLQWSPKVFDSPFLEVIVTTVAIGVCNTIKVDLCEV